MKYLVQRWVKQVDKQGVDKYQFDFRDYRRMVEWQNVNSTVFMYKGD